MSLSLVVSGFFSSCTKEDDPDGPQIEFSNSLTETTLAKGVTQWEINATLTSVTGLDEVKVFKVTSSGEDQLGEAITKFDDENSYNLKLTITGVTDQTTIKVTATDKNDVTNSKNFVIKVTANDPPAASDKLLFWTETYAAQLGAQSNAAGSSFATSTGKVYTKSEAQKNSSLVDFIYYYDDTNLAEIMSPSFAGTTGNLSWVASSSFATKNATKFKTTSVTASEFDAIAKTDESLVVSTGTDLTLDRVTKLVTGNVFSFKTAAGKLGLAKVKALTSGNSGTITVEVKVQQ